MSPPPQSPTAEPQAVVEVVRDSEGVIRATHRESVGAEDPEVGIVAVELEKMAEILGQAVNEMGGEGRLIRSVPKQRAEPVMSALSRVLLVLLGSARDRSVSQEELRLRTQAATDTLDTLLHGDSEQLASVIESLKPPTSSESDPDRAETRGRLRLQALYRRIIRDSYTVKDLTAMRLSRQRLQQLRSENRLFAVEVPHHKGFLYPRWQFDRSGRPRAEMPELIAAAREAGLDAISFHQLMLSEDAGDAGPPIDSLDRGEVEEVLGIIRAGGE